MFITPMSPLGEISGFHAEQPNPQAGPAGLPFKEIFSTAIQNMKETEIISNNDTALLALGDIDDLHTLGIDATKAYLAEKLVIELRNRAMEAYSEIMRINL
ncbi:MAG: flagellar hook-basal body complex protein FliE [Clostridiales bacterium]|nr:flagellar hook-basal body complex protein FliE [Clostridiales bacterium]